MKNKGFGFTVQQVMDVVFDYAKVTVTIHSYAKASSHAKATGAPSNPKDSRRTAADTSLTSEEVSGVNTNNDGTFTLDGKVYPLKAFVS